MNQNRCKSICLLLVLPVPFPGPLFSLTLYFIRSLVIPLACLFARLVLHSSSPAFLNLRLHWKSIQFGAHYIYIYIYIAAYVFICSWKYYTCIYLSLICEGTFSKNRSSLHTGTRTHILCRNNPKLAILTCNENTFENTTSREKMFSKQK